MGDTLDGDTFAPSDLTGTIEVTNVWGSRCGPGRAQTPDLVRLAREYPARRRCGPCLLSALLFGAFRYARVDGTSVTTVAEGLIYADDLPETNPSGYGLLQDYVRSHKADAEMCYLGAEPSWNLELVSRTVL